MSDGRPEAIKIALTVDGPGWRTVAWVNGGCFAVVIGGVAVGSLLAYGTATALGATLFFLAIFWPFLWVSRFAFRAAQVVAWIEVAVDQVTVHHPAMFREPLALGYLVHSYFVGDLPGIPPPTTPGGEESVSPRFWGQSRAADRQFWWRPPVEPSAVAPDLLTVTQARGWNLVLVLCESFFLDGLPKRSVGFLRLVTRGSACRRSPRRRSWIRGFFTAVDEPEAAIAALDRAGIARTDLTPEVLAWLSNDPPAPFGRAVRNLIRDHRRKMAGPSSAE